MKLTILEITELTVIRGYPDSSDIIFHNAERFVIHQTVERRKALESKAIETELCPGLSQTRGTPLILDYVVHHI